MPQSGSVSAKHLDYNGANTLNWVSNISGTTPQTYAWSPTATSCMDNGGVGGVSWRYSVGLNDGNNVNCALSFKFK